MKRNRVESARILRALATALCHVDEPDWPRILRLQAGARALAWANWWERRATVRDANRLTREANEARPLEVST